MNDKIRTYCVACLVIVFISLGSNSHANLMADISYIETSKDDAWWYDYTFTNESDPFFDLFKVDFSFDKSVVLIGYNHPNNWEIFHGSGFIDTVSIIVGPPPDGGDIVPGQSLGGFTFHFNTRVEQPEFVAWFQHRITKTEYTIEGTAAPVPEPATILLLVSGVLGLGMLGRKKIQK